MRHRDLGVLVYDKAKATPGYTLIVPQSSTKAYLIGMRGEVLHEWSFPLCPGNYAYLLPNGNLLWAGRMDEGPPLRRGKGGLLREYNWDGEVVWEYCDPAQHHDFRRRPDGNTIYIGWEPVPADVAAPYQGRAARQRARRPHLRRLREGDLSGGRYGVGMARLA